MLLQGYGTNISCLYKRVSWLATYCANGLAFCLGKRRELDTIVIIHRQNSSFENATIRFEGESIRLSLTRVEEIEIPIIT